MVICNPWHGCHKVSEGCAHCYMYFLDSKRGLDTSHVFRTENFTMPIQRRRNGQFKLPSGMMLYVGLSTDFLSGLSYQGRKVPRLLRMPEGTLFGTDIISPEPFFRPHCATCGSRMTCNGCSNCGACDNNKSSQQVEIEV